MWGQTVVAVAAHSVPALPSSPGDDRDLDAELDNLERLIEHTPSVALQQTFALVERELRRVVEEEDLEPPGLRGLTPRRRPSTHGRWRRTKRRK
jgi:hypothetical protein